MFIRSLLPALLMLLWLASARAADSCVVLQFHHVDKHTPAITSVTPAQFRDQLQLIESLGMQVLPLRQIIDSMREGRALPERCLGLSFDDAYESVYRTAWPLLRARGWPFTVFVPTESIDQHRHPYMNWTQLRELARQGVGIESHSHHHGHLIRQRPGESPADWQARVAADLDQAQQRILEQIGQQPRLFAWPYGEYMPELGPVLRQFDLTGFGQQSGAFSAASDFTALPRFPSSGPYAALDTLHIKLLSLPLPLADVQPVSPLTPVGQFRPGLTLTLKNAYPPDYPHSLLRCYVDGSSDVALAWSPADPLRVTATPEFDLSAGRHRTNCTLPSSDPRRFHWYSHPWFIRQDDGSWYRE